MKRVLFITAMFSLVFAATSARADFYGGQVLSNRIPGHYSGNGGEFTLSQDPAGGGLNLNLSAYSGLTKNLSGSTGVPSFQTFCLEKGEYISSPMDIVVSTTSINELTGAVGSPGSGSHAIWGGKTYGDNLDPLTAYLYTEFATGVLSNYDYGAGRATSAGQLQKAIWYLEGEITSLTSGSQADTWVTEAQNSGWTSIRDVRILNTWAVGHIGDPSYRKQDQLYITPIPASLILGLLGLGVVGVKLRKYA